jgi:integrase/recombinase XerD
MNWKEAVTLLRTRLRGDGYRMATLRTYTDQLKRFGEWLDREGIRDVRRITPEQLRAYQTYVRSEPVCNETQGLRLRAVKRLYRFFVDEGKLLLDPSDGLQDLNRRKTLPRPILSRSEVTRLLAVPDVSEPLGVRNRAVLEVLYATGLRVGELERLTCQDVDWVQQTLHLRQTKNGQPRMVPLGQHAAAWLKRYVDDVRPQQIRKCPEARALFVVRGGATLGQFQIRSILTVCARAAKLGKAVSPHLLRHSCATHLLQAGADIRVIQELLGHTSIASTMLYTHVAPVDVKAMHSRYHPGGGQSHASD